MTRRGRKLLLAGAGALSGVAVGTAAGAFLLHRARTRPDPDRAEDLAERPGTELRIDSFDGTELAVNVVGPRRRARDAPTLVFAHGFTLDMTAWHFQWKALSTDFRCVLYDQRGHGRSAPAAGGDYSLEAFGHDLRAVIDAAVPRGPIVLIGHSLGGMSVISFAGLHPGRIGRRIRAVVLANTSAGDLLKAMLGAAGARAGAYLLPWTRRLTRDPARLYRWRSGVLSRGGGLAFVAARVTNFGSNAPPSVVEHVVRLAARAPVEVWTDVFASLMELRLDDALAKIRVPTLIVAGDMDRLTPPASALAIKRALPHARMVVLRGAGHCTPLERHEQFNALLRRFVREVAEPAAGARAAK
jgi:pimeloyl-ACP methyl ester carboxylesterase